MKYKSHRRYREPVVVEAPKRIHSKMKKAPEPLDVMRARKAVYRAKERHSARHYKKHRDKTDRIVSEILEKYKIANTSTHEYWRLCFVCILIGARI